MEKLLDELDLPADLKKLSLPELERLTAEMREELLEIVAGTGGHLASSLGAAELTVALHVVFEPPEDKLVWDVGHQAYIHKMLTGRRLRFPTLRQRDGISGFPRPDESPYDSFVAGHAGTSISAAAGMALAMKQRGISRHAVAVIGDGAMTNGMAFEALNHAGGLELENIVVVLNDNQMSISPNVGAVRWFFSRTVTSPWPTRARNRLKALYKEGRLPAWLFRTMDGAEGATQGFISGPARLFEAFGFRYIGPIDGHNLAALITSLRNAKAQGAPVLVHCCTRKGKGYAPAEEDPLRWHGVTPFRRENGTTAGIAPKAPGAPLSYTEVFGDELLRLAREDRRLVAITAAMTEGTGLAAFKQAFPDRVIDVGICEQHAVTLAAGLAAEGMKPVCAIYSSFLQRAIDQVMHDVCLQRLPVVFAIDRAGVVGPDGATHQGVFDIAMLRTLPDIVLMSPRDESELRSMLHTALRLNCPAAIRYPRACGIGGKPTAAVGEIPLGRAEVLQEGEDLLFVCYGPVVHHALQAACRLEAELGITVTVVNARFAKPLDAELLSRLLPRHAVTATVEDHALAGGFGAALLELTEERGIHPSSPLLRFGVKDAYVMHATQAEQHRMNGFDAQSIFTACHNAFHGWSRAKKFALPGA